MSSNQVTQDSSGGLIGILSGTVGRLIAAIFVPIIAFVILWQGFIFLRDTEASNLLIVIVAIVWGVGGVGLLYVVANWVVEQLPDVARNVVLPYVFVGPAMAILTLYLLWPTVNTLYLSFLNRTSQEFVGLRNYQFAFTDPAMIESFRNNLLWLILGTGGCVVFGLLIAILADRSRFEAVAKSFIFLPMAISFVGASVIWRFVYAFRPAGQNQIGLLNAITTFFGAEPTGWLITRGLNNFALIIILIWLQTGFAMVLLSAALKAVPEDLLEAGRIDGANEIQIFFRIIIPTIRGTIVTVSTTILILTLKIFDIVFVMTGGRLGTEVIASRMYKEMFVFADFGRGSAIAIVLLILVIPVMWYNLRSFNEEGAI